jgi:polar amino acid transport system permease protein
MTLDFAVVLAQWPIFLRGLWLTCALTVVMTLFGTLLGIACAWARVNGPKWLGMAVGFYVEIFRNTPFILQLFFIFFGLPSLGIKLDPVAASIVALVLDLGAYSSEIIRAGLEATPRSQIEAAQSLALTRWQTFTRVVLPPSLSRVWPALVSQIIIVMLVSAICSQISTRELSYSADLISSRTFHSFESYLVATALYLGLAILLRQVLNWVGPRFIFGR